VEKGRRAPRWYSCSKLSLFGNRRSYKMDIVTQDEMEFLRLLLKCDANLNQEKKHLKTKLARKDFSEYVEVSPQS
jgi:hypothetical protein